MEHDGSRNSLEQRLNGQFWHSPEVAEQLANAEFVTLPGQAHRPFGETPDDFNARVDAFWRYVASRQP